MEQQTFFDASFLLVLVFVFVFLSVVSFLLEVAIVAVLRTFLIVVDIIVPYQVSILVESVVDEGRDGWCSSWGQIVRRIILIYISRSSKSKVRLERGVGGWCWRHGAEAEAEAE
jgi:hypothetical protein